eukprot:15438320-Alexandrium_andersonii.AAC.1
MDYDLKPRPRPEIQRRKAAVACSQAWTPRMSASAPVLKSWLVQNIPRRLEFKPPKCEYPVIGTARCLSSENSS